MQHQVLLVAEDDASDALLLERALRRTGSLFRMIRVANGEEAIAYVEGRGDYGNRQIHPVPQVVLLDLKMPRKDGFDVLRWRRETPGGARLPMVVFSSSNLRQDVDLAYALGANSYVVKPTAPERLESMVRALHQWWAEFNLPGSPVCT